MDKNKDSAEGIRILSFDNGGPGSYSQLLIMKEYMSRVASDLDVDECDVYPADYFDLMGGVGFGGLVALMLGHFRMNVGQAIDALVSVATTVFPYDAQEKADPDTNVKHLIQSVENMLQARQIPLDIKMNDKRYPSVKCKVAIYTATKADLSHPTIFRTYPSRGTSINPTIVEAVCATMATPSFFGPITIGSRPRELQFVGGPIGVNNPTRDLLNEASATFGKDRRVAQIISIGSGRRRILAMNESAAIDEAGLLLEYMASDCEMVAKELSARLYMVEAYLRLNVDRGMENIFMDEWGELGYVEVHTNAYVGSTAISLAIESSLRRIKKRIGTVSLSQINYSSGIKSQAKTVPAVCPYFVVRKREWDLILQHLVTSTLSGRKVLAITGMGGCGKTQIVSYFLREYQSLPRFVHIVFVDASSAASLEADLEVWARSLGDGHEQDVWEDGLRILADGSNSGRWVLVLDNADDPALKLVPFFPSCYEGTIVITSRNRDVGILSTYHLEMGRMETEEALSTLLQASQRQPPLPPEELESAHVLINELGCLAVALVHAGTHCRQLSSAEQGVFQSYTFTSYLGLFYSERAALMSKVGPPTLDGYERGVYTTLDLSYRAIPENARAFLLTISHLHHSNIPLTMLAVASENSFKDPYIYLPRPNEQEIAVSQLTSLLCTEGRWSELRVQEIIQTLRSFSLVSVTAIEDAVILQLHPLVQAWARDMQIFIAQDYRAMATQIVTSCCLDNHGIRLPDRFLVPHIKAVLSYGLDLHVNDKTAFGAILMREGYYYDAETCFGASLKALQCVFQEETPATLQVARCLARAYYHQEDWEKAGLLCSKLVEKSRKILGINDLGTIEATVTLAAIYSNQGRLEEAEEMETEVLKQRRRLFGERDRETMAAASNLAQTYTLRGKLKESEALQSEVLKQWRIEFGTEHSETIRMLVNLACTYALQERLVDAEALLLEALEQGKRTLGLEHPAVSRVVVTLAEIYAPQNRWQEIEALLIPAFRHSIKAMGQRHPNTQLCIRTMVEVYRRLGKGDEANEAEKLLLP